MKKQELIEKLQSLPDNLDVKLFDHRMNLHEGGGEPSSAGVYSVFDIEVINNDISDDEKKYYKDMYDGVPKAFIAITFENDDYES